MNEPAFLVTVEILRASNGIEYVVCVAHNDGQGPKSIAFPDSIWENRNYKQRYQAEYERALLERFLNKWWCVNIDILDFDEEHYPNER